MWLFWSMKCELNVDCVGWSNKKPMHTLVSFHPAVNGGVICSSRCSYDIMVPLPIWVLGWLHGAEPLWQPATSSILSQKPKNIICFLISVVDDLKGVSLHLLDSVFYPIAFSMFFPLFTQPLLFFFLIYSASNEKRIDFCFLLVRLGRWPLTPADYSLGRQTPSMCLQLMYIHQGPLSLLASSMHLCKYNVLDWGRNQFYLLC